MALSIILGMAVVYIILAFILLDKDKNETMSPKKHLKWYDKKDNKKRFD